MPGYDDPRFLQQKIEKLEKDLKELKATSLPFLIHQRGAVPGTMRAVQIGDVAQKSSMWISLIGNQPGQSPYQAVTDTTGTVRAELGNLAANGISPAQYGFRVSDAGGTPIFDSLGLISVMQVIAQQSSGVLNQQINGPVTAAAITSSSTTFSLTRTLRVLTFYSAIFSCSSGTGFCYVNARMDSSDAGGNNHHFMLTLIPTGSTNETFVQGFHVRVDSLAAGSHTADITADVDAATQIQVYKTGLYIFQLGS